ncbi:purine-nucleoside phosphorylase [Plantibacter flavus]|uniref:purine-nucleoside phosphorylase n=1 Tax=Plantibacter flavus TaxID=150123 RepID=UPI003F14F11E
MHAQNSDPFALAQAAADVIATRTGITRHRIAITLGSGWKAAADHLGETVAEVSAPDVPGFTVSGVAGHTGVLRSVRMSSGEYALIIGARTHLYEGHGVDAVVHGVRTAAAAGAEVMVLTNGAGGLNREWRAGQPVLIRDHLNLTARSPIVGPTFVDLTDLYSARLRALAHEVDPFLDDGIYTQLPGPHYETPAEVRMVRALGGDIVGMSTALEAIAARQAGLEVLGMSLITNLAAGIQKTPLNHSEVLEAGLAAEDRLGPLLARIVNRITEAGA